MEGFLIYFLFILLEKGEREREPVVPVPQANFLRVVLYWLVADHDDWNLIPKFW